MRLRALLPAVAVLASLGFSSTPVARADSIVVQPPAGTFSSVVAILTPAK